MKAITDSAECQAAAKNLDLNVLNSQNQAVVKIESSSQSLGCSVNGKTPFFNTFQTSTVQCTTANPCICEPKETVKLSTDSCEATSGMQVITNSALCLAAVNKLGYSARNVATTNTGGGPPGCYFRPSSVNPFVPYGIYFNPQTTSSRQCKQDQPCVCESTPGRRMNDDSTVVDSTVQLIETTKHQDTQQDQDREDKDQATTDEICQAWLTEKQITTGNMSYSMYETNHARRLPAGDECYTVSSDAVRRAKTFQGVDYGGKTVCCPRDWTKYGDGSACLRPGGSWSVQADKCMLVGNDLDSACPHPCDSVLEATGVSSYQCNGEDVTTASAASGSSSSSSSGSSSSSDNWTSHRSVNNPQYAGEAPDKAECYILCQNKGAKFCAYQCNGCWAGDSLKTVSGSSHDSCFQFGTSVTGRAMSNTVSVDGSGSESGNSNRASRESSSCGATMSSSIFLYVVLGLIGLIVILWLRDLCILGSLLDTTTVEMTSTNAMVPNEWSEPWACFLNNDEEASMAIQLLHQFSRSYRVHDRSRH
jgi:hypothetical protein